MKICLLFLLVSAVAVPAAPLEEEKVSYAGAAFRVVKVPPERLELVWKDAQGQPYRTFGRVQAALAAGGRKPLFLMNAGIFEPGGIPSGLHVEKGKVLKPLNLAAGKGNFFLRPNGVLAVLSGGAGEKPRALIRESAAFAAERPRGLILAAQSGPLLLAGGRRHPAFREGSENRLHRNGAGIAADGTVVFAITAKHQFVNLWDFAGLFLTLGCKDALFLDGDLSQMALSPAAPVESNRFGAIFVVAE